MNQTFITLTKPFAFRGDLLLKKEAKASLSTPQKIYFLFRKKKQKRKHTSLIYWVLQTEPAVLKCPL